MQCIFVVLLCFGLLGFEFYNRRDASASLTSERMTDKAQAEQEDKEASTPQEGKPRHQDNFELFLVDFHKAQCYFSATIQIAALSYGIFETDMLVTFMLTPLATNGVLPIIFAYTMLFHYGRSTLDVTLLTLVCWVLSSIVYWILYSHIIPINSQIRGDNRRYRAYQQFFYKLTALDACGGYSALAVCPDNFHLGREDILRKSTNLRVLTPIIWSFSTMCLLAVLFSKYMKARRDRANTHPPLPNSEQSAITSNERSRPSVSGSNLQSSLIYWLTILCFLAGIGMQLSLLSIGTSLNMMDRTNWSFGQIVAVTIWVQPLLHYFYEEFKDFLKVRNLMQVDPNTPSQMHTRC